MLDEIYESIRTKIRTSNISKETIGEIATLWLLL